MMRRYFSWALGTAMLCTLLLFSPLALAEAPVYQGGFDNDTELISIGLSDTPANDNSVQSSVSWDGNLVLFTSFASNLVPTDTNDVVDVFLRDREAGTTERISRRASGAQVNDASGGAMMNPIGTLFTYYSFATNVVPSDTNGFSDIFVAQRDPDTAAITVARLSMGYAGDQANGDSFLSDLTDDGSRIVFDSVASNLVPVDDNTWSDIFLFDATTETTEKLSIANNNAPGNDRSERPRITADGEFVIFQSFATNLVPNDNNNAIDLFGVDMTNRNMRRLSVNAQGQDANLGIRPAEYAMTPDGRYVVFASDSSNLVTGDTNNAPDIFLLDLEENTIRLVSVAANGTRANGGSYDPSISANGRYIAFNTVATNLFPNDTNGITDAVVVDRFTRMVQPVAVSYDGAPVNGDSGTPQFSEDGLSVTFYSDAANLVISDTNELRDIFWRDFHSLIPKSTYLPLGARNYQFEPCLRTDVEPNNNSGNATTNPIICQDSVLNGSIPAGDPGDYYRFVLTGNANVTVQLFSISQGSDFDLYLYNSSLGLLGSSTNNGNANEQVGPVSLTPGTYFIRLYPDPTEPGGNRTYQLRWSR